MQNESQASLILARLADTPGEWVPMPELAAVSGSWNVHTRIDQLRHDCGHHIDNRLIRSNVTRHRKESSYRLILPDPASSSDHSQLSTLSQKHTPP